MEIKANDKPFVAFCILFLLLIYTIENINHRFWLNDFKVYYDAAQSFRSEKPVYDNLFALGSGFYKYAPCTLFFFIPFTLLPYYIASILHFFILSASIIGIFIICRKIFLHFFFRPEIKTKKWWLYITFISCANHFVRELHLGNINVILLFLLCLSLWQLLNRKEFSAGFLLSVVITTKPFFGLLVLPLLFRHKFKTLVFTGIFLLAYFLAPAFHVGISENIQLHKAWLQTMMTHNDGFPANNTIESMITSIFQISKGIKIQLPLLTIAIAMIAAFIFFNRKSEKKNEYTTAFHLIPEWFIVIAILPNLFKTDTQHFLLSLPLIMMLLGMISLNSTPLLTGMVCLALVCFGGNTTDILGHHLSALIASWGVLGGSNLLLITLVAVMYRKKPLKMYCKVFVNLKK